MLNSIRNIHMPDLSALQVAVHIMGKGGAALVLIMLFMAVTSTGSAEQIAVSSIFAYGMFLVNLSNAVASELVMWQIS